ncbi:hypothetical protein GCM10009850_083660 [Nonomuraea monospora]|uniref:Uncharacterized protein n=1 Tax=Nonomuraea monospora TaxID=568818 RepID=A0ABN3CTY8_9ACTN
MAVRVGSDSLRAAAAVSVSVLITPPGVPPGGQDATTGTSFPGDPPPSLDPGVVCAKLNAVA